MDAHSNEYAAAVNGMAEVYGSPLELPAVGDFVNGITCGRRWSGYVLTAEPGRLAVECDGAWIVVHPDDVTRA
jgi:hypothetical protein